MDYFPAFLSLDDRDVLLVGGGNVAARKARLLVAARARVTIVSPETVTAIDSLVSGGKAAYLKRTFRASDLDGKWLVVSASNDPATERAVAIAAADRQVFCNAVDDKDNCSFITPAIVDRSPVIVAISSAGTAPVLARRIRARIEALLPQRTGELAKLAGRWRSRVADGLRDFATRLRFWQTVFDGPVASDVSRGELIDAEARLAATFYEFSAAGSAASPGEAWLVGAGPGDPELLTLKALQAMQQADVILHDRLVSDDILALARRDAEFISVGKTPGCVKNSQENINERLVELVASGKRVCRLKGGDPFIFGRGGEEAEALEAAGLTYSVIPGITAAAGCAAAAGIPLTHRDAAQSLVLVTGHGKNSVDTLDWASLARERQTLAVYMGVRRFPDIMQQLTAHGRSAETPVAIIERGTTAEQRVVRGSLGQLPMLAEAHRLQSPAMLIIGEVAKLGRGAPEPGNAATRPLSSTTLPEKSAIQAR